MRECVSVCVRLPVCRFKSFSDSATQSERRTRWCSTLVVTWQGPDVAGSLSYNRPATPHMPLPPQGGARRARVGLSVGRWLWRTSRKEATLNFAPANCNACCSSNSLPTLIYIKEQRWPFQQDVCSDEHLKCASCQRRHQNNGNNSPPLPPTDGRERNAGVLMNTGRAATGQKTAISQPSSLPTPLCLAVALSLSVC